MQKVVCIGAGRLAHHMMPQLETAGCRVVQVYNRTESKAASLSKKLKSSSFTSRIEEVQQDADLYILTLSDDVIRQVSDHLLFANASTGVFVHCSGVTGLDALPFKRRGVFYPLQSFSENHFVPWTTTPILITADMEEVQRNLVQLAEKISQEVYVVNDQQKAFLHLAAVFANNFSNHMLTIAEKICAEHDVPFKVLKPLIRETMEKAIDAGPSLSQTGPAVRGDQNTIKKHLALLSDHPGLVDLYKAITKNIMDSLPKKGK